ncbi:hypothetical protein D9M71_782850 [compost metagenome]
MPPHIDRAQDEHIGGGFDSQLVGGDINDFMAWQVFAQVLVGLVVELAGDDRVVHACTSVSAARPTWPNTTSSCGVWIRLQSTSR